MKIERTKNAKRNIIYGISLKIYQIFFPFVLRTVMIKYLGVQYLGLSSLFVSILQVLNLAELGVGSAMVYSMYKPIVDDNVKMICALMNLYRRYYRIIGMIIAGIGGVLTPFVPKLINGDVPVGINIYILYWFNLAATVVSYWLYAYKNCLLMAHQRTDVMSKATMFTSTIQYILQLISICVFENYYMYIVVALITQILNNIVVALFATRYYPIYVPKGNLSEKEKSDIDHRIRDLFTAKLGSVVVGAFDTVVISAFLGLAILAIYQNYYYIMNAVCSFITVIFSAVMAGIGNSFVTESIEKNYYDLRKFTFIICWVINICCCCFLCLYQPFMVLWVGDDLLLPFGCVILFCVYFFVCELALIWTTVKDAAGLWHADRYRPLLGSLVNLALNLLLVNYIGIYGILLSTIISYIFVSMPWLIYNLFTQLYLVKVKSYLVLVFKVILATVISCLLSYGVCRVIDLSGLIAIVINGMVCVVVSNIIQILFFRNSSEYRDSLVLLKKIFHK